MIGRAAGESGRQPGGDAQKGKKRARMSTQSRRDRFIDPRCYPNCQRQKLRNK
jgi:hypothetical protein